MGFKIAHEQLIQWCWRRQRWLLVDEFLPGSEQMRLINFRALVFDLWIRHCVRTWDRHQVRPSISNPANSFENTGALHLKFLHRSLHRSELCRKSVPEHTSTPTLICNVMHRRTYMRAPIYGPSLIWLLSHLTFIPYILCTPHCSSPFCKHSPASSFCKC